MGDIDTVDQATEYFTSEGFEKGAFTRDARYNNLHFIRTGPDSGLGGDVAGIFAPESGKYHFTFVDIDESKFDRSIVSMVVGGITAAVEGERDDGNPRSELQKVVDAVLKQAAEKLGFPKDVTIGSITIDVNYHPYVFASGTSFNEAYSSFKSATELAGLKV